MSTVAVTALSVCTTSAQDLGVLGRGETLTPEDTTACFDRLNTLVDSWAAERGSIFTQAITSYTYPANTPLGVTLGPGGTWNQARPVFLSGANYVVPGSSPAVRIPLELYSDETYFALGIPTLTSALPTGLYYNPTMASAGGLGRVTLYPVPTQDISIGIQTPTQISQFADLTTEYLLPPAVRRALHFNLILDICDLFGREPTARMNMNAFNSKQAMKVPNFEKLVLAIDPAVTNRGGGGYVIYSDTRGGVVTFAQFVGADYKSDSVNTAASELINWMVERTESATDQSPFPASLFPRPGLGGTWTGLSGPIRGVFSQDGRVFAVGGDTLYELSGYGTSAELGTVAVDDHPVSFASNGHGGHQLLLISGGLGYIFDLSSNAFQQINDPSFPANAVMCDFLDGYFLVLQASTSKVFISDSFNGLSWDASNVISVSSSSDELKAIRVIQRVCWMIGSLRTEPWVTTGASSILAPMSNVLLEYGIGAVWSVVECDGAMFLIGQTQNGGPQLLQFQGYQVGRVSTHMQERVWAALPDPSNIRTFSYQERGHTFCVVCPNTGPAQVYDLATGVWATWGAWNEGEGRYDPLLQWCHAYGFGMHIVGDRTTGTVYQQSVTLGTDDGTPIRRVRTAPHLNTEKQSNFGHEVTIEMEAGLGDASDPNPTMDLLWSKDGGHTWSAPVTTSMGVMGQYARRVKWTRCPGKFEDLVLSAVTSALVPVRLMACYLRVTPGTGMR